MSSYISKICRWQRLLIFLCLLASQFSVLLLQHAAFAQSSTSQNSYRSFDNKTNAVMLKLKHYRSLNDDSKIQSQLRYLVFLKNQTDYKNLSQISNQLLQFGYLSIKSKDFKIARLFYNSALELSPTSLDVRVASFKLGLATKSSSPFLELGKMITIFSKNPDSYSSLIVYGGYLLLASLICGLYFVIGSILVVNSKRIRLNFQKKFCQSYIENWKLLLLPPILFVPLFTTPLWCLFAWSLTLLAFIPGAKQLSLITALTILLATIAIPTLENIKLWNDSKGMSSVLTVFSDDFDSINIAEIKKLSTMYKNEELFRYAYAKALTRAGKIDTATEIKNNAGENFNFGTGLTFIDVMSLLKIPHRDQGVKEHLAFDRLMGGITPMLGMSLSLGLIALILLFNKTQEIFKIERKEVENLPLIWKILLFIIPGGVYILVNKLERSVVLSSGLIILTTPVLFWGKEMSGLFQIFPGYFVIYLSLVSALVLFNYIFSFYMFKSIKINL